MVTADTVQTDPYMYQYPPKQCFQLLFSKSSKVLL